jgi:hypothetical protein
VPVFPDNISSQEEFKSQEQFKILNSKTVPLHAMKAYVGVKVQLNSFLTSVTDEDESPSRPGQFILAEKTDTHRRLSGAGGGLDDLQHRNVSAPRLQSKPGSPSPKASHYTD